MLKLLVLEPSRGERGEETEGWEYLHCPKPEFCDNEAIRMFRMCSLINSPGAVVTELCRTLLSMDEVDVVEAPPFLAKGN